MGFRVPQKQAPGKRLPAYKGHGQGRVDKAEDPNILQLFILILNTSPNIPHMFTMPRLHVRSLPGIIYNWG